ncbi:MULTISPECIES: aminotransferase class I/II-fold pyridoxal phosphate-dependent enzyme [unclassified Cryobacterium]|uniref:aminotransferase class I/II-fold pyridoxal phosphate-dependent enzyme n=1 Tax=unclassified Cryobacterium TaxID=2649013 RepID=UPI0014478C4D
MAIPYGHQSIDDDDVAAVATAVRGEWLTMGPTVAEFEAAIAGIAGVPEAVAVSSGTAALHCAYAAIGFDKGSVVVTTPLTFVATASTAILSGATVEFADVQEDTGNIDPHAVNALITERTRAVAAVDYAGHPADFTALREAVAGHDVVILEDAAHSIASTYRERPVGSVADITTFSFFPTKNLTTAEGGAIVSTRSELLERARRFKSHGLVRDKHAQRYPDEGPWHQEVHELGLNYRLPDVLAALGLSQLKRLHDFKDARKKVFQRYAEGLGDLDGVRLPHQRAYVDPMWHLFPIRVSEDRRRSVFEFLREQGVLVQVNYIPAYWHPYFEDLGYKRGMCPVAEQYYKEEISLPMFANLSASDQDRVIELVRKALS